MLVHCILLYYWLKHIWWWRHVLHLQILPKRPTKCGAYYLSATVATELPFSLCRMECLVVASINYWHLEIRQIKQRSHVELIDPNRNLHTPKVHDQDEKARMKAPCAWIWKLCCSEDRLEIIKGGEKWEHVVLRLGAVQSFWKLE